MLLAALLVALSLAGLLDALYFVAVTYRWIQPDAAWLPRVCRMDQATCATIVDTPEARALGLPNALYGLLWYAGVLGAGLTWLATGQLPAAGWLLGVSVGTVLFSAYLAWALLGRLKVACPLCFLGHGINLAILLVLLLGLGL